MSIPRFQDTCGYGLCALLVLAAVLSWTVAVIGFIRLP